MTTNHIEMIWVELEKTLEHMTLEKSLRCLNLESYRQLRLYGEKDVNVVRLLCDIALVWREVLIKRQRGAQA